MPLSSRDLIRRGIAESDGALAPRARLATPRNRRNASFHRDRFEHAKQSSGQGLGAHAPAALRANLGEVWTRNAERPSRVGTSFAEIPTAMTPGMFLGPPGDRFEAEAESAASRVVRGWGDVRGRGSRLATAPTPLSAPAGATPVSRRLAERVARASGGEPMSAEIRRPAETLFGASFQDVRIHRGPDSDRLNDAFHARAFTIGSHIFLGRQPGSAPSRQLLAHELTHVLQQRSYPGAPQVIQRGPTADAPQVIEPAPAADAPAVQEESYDPPPPPFRAQFNQALEDFKNAKYSDAAVKFTDLKPYASRLPDVNLDDFIAECWKRQGELEMESNPAEAMQLFQKARGASAAVTQEASMPPGDIGPRHRGRQDIDSRLRTYEEPQHRALWKRRAEGLVAKSTAATSPEHKRQLLTMAAELFEQAELYDQAGRAFHAARDTARAGIARTQARAGGLIAVKQVQPSYRQFASGGDSEQVASRAAEAGGIKLEEVDARHNPWDDLLPHLEPIKSWEEYVRKVREKIGFDVDAGIIIRDMFEAFTRLVRKTIGFDVDPGIVNEIIIYVFVNNNLDMPDKVILSKLIECGWEIEYVDIADVKRRLRKDDLPPAVRRVKHPTVEYIRSPEERAQFRLTVKGGALFRGAETTPFSTHGMSTYHSGVGWCIFVVSPGGEFYVATHRLSEFHHSSILAGSAAAAAGEMQVENGMLRTISNKSGHYQPGPRALAWALEKLQAMGVDLSSTAINLTNFDHRLSIELFFRMFGNVSSSAPAASPGYPMWPPKP